MLKEKIKKIISNIRHFGEHTPFFIKVISCVALTLVLMPSLTALPHIKKIIESASPVVKNINADVIGFALAFFISCLVTTALIIEFAYCVLYMSYKLMMILRDKKQRKQKETEVNQ